MKRGWEREGERTIKPKCVNGERFKGGRGEGGRQEMREGRKCEVGGRVGKNDDGRAMEEGKTWEIRKGGKE